MIAQSVGHDGSIWLLGGFSASEGLEDGVEHANEFRDLSLEPHDGKPFRIDQSEHPEHADRNSGSHASGRHDTARLRRKNPNVEHNLLGILHVPN